MLSPRFAKVMLEQYRRNNMVADSSFRGAAKRLLEPKFGWGHEAWVKELSEEIKSMHFDSTWTPTQVLNYVSKYVESCVHENPSSIKHPNKAM